MNNLVKYRIPLFIAIGAVLFFAVVAVVASMGKSRGYDTSGVAMPELPAHYEYDGDALEAPRMARSAAPSGAYNDSLSGGGYREGGEPTAAPLPFAAEQKLIKTGGLDLTVTDVETAATTIRSVTIEHGGIVADTQIYDTSGERKTASIVVRIPAEAFDRALDAYKAAATRVNRESISVNDVGEEYADIEAQLTNKRAVEAQYLTTLARAVAVEDILSVQERLDQVRGEIERLEGRKNYFDRQVAMSTLSISLTPESESTEVTLAWDPGNRIASAWASTVEGLMEFCYAMIEIVFLLPLLMLWLGFFGGVVYLLYRFVRFIYMRTHTRSSR